MIMFLDSLDAIDATFLEIEDAASKAHQWISQQSDDPMRFLKSVKFEKQGSIRFHKANLIKAIRPGPMRLP